MEDPQRVIDRYLLTGRLRSHEAAALRDWLKSDPNHVRHFVFESYVNRGIHEILMSERIHARECKPSAMDSLFHAIAEKRQMMEPLNSEREDLRVRRGESDDSTLRVPLENAESPEERIRIVEDYAQQQLEVFLSEQEQYRRRPQRCLWSGPHWWWHWRQAAARVETLFRTACKMVVATAFLLFFGLVLWAGVRYILNHRVVATLGESQMARWDVPPQKLELRRGQLFLEEGWAQIKFVSGAEVILQAPCALDLRSSRRVFLEDGLLTARIVSPRAQGFTVQTPNSRVVDFGTEFGVLARQGKDSEVHVFDGQVRLEPVYQDKHKGRSRELVEGRSARIDQKGTLTEGALQEDLFYRSLPSTESIGIPGKRLDLADILGGGNGFGRGQMNCSIDPLTGRYSAYGRQKYYKKGTGRYVPVAENAFIDGVFIPNGGQGAGVVISSQGHIFQGCPKTNGAANGEIQNTHRTIHVNLDEMNYRPRLGNRIFDTAGHPHIYMQANVGMTFDLDAIRNRLMDNRIRRFVAECGVCTEIPKDDEKVDFWVLVDGQVQFSCQDATKADGATKISVPLREQDRFLTLAITEGTDGSWLDLGLFVEPALELGPNREKPE